MPKPKMPDVFISPERVLREAKKKGVVLGSDFVIVGELMGKVKVELDRKLSKLALL